MEMNSFLVPSIRDYDDIDLSWRLRYKEASSQEPCNETEWIQI